MPYCSAFQSVSGIFSLFSKAGDALEDDRERQRREKRARIAQMAANGHPSEGGAVAPTFAPSGVFADEAAGGAGAGEAEVSKKAGRGRARGGGGHPCPPQLLRRHVPCKDTTAMDTEAFLAHLQTLSWYKGQVGCTASKGLWYIENSSRQFTARAAGK